MNLKLRFTEHIKSADLFSPKDKLLLAVSGGVDSVVLCELCKQAGYDFTIAHCNFQLRDEESERDEAFVKSLGSKYGVEVKVERFETQKYAAENKLSIQETARELRYNWFKELINELTDKPINHLLTAHHRDDNIETVLMNFFRGTGLSGLTGIPEKSGYIRRPLLEFSKEELVAFARENKLDWVEDSSNKSSKYTRNVFRNEIIPAITKVYPQVKRNLADNIDRFREIEKLYRLGADAIIKKLCKVKGKELYIPVKQLMGYDNKALIYEIISNYGFTEKQVDEVIKLSESESGKYTQSPSGEYRIIRHRHWFIISPGIAIDSENIIIEEGDKNLQFAMGSLEFKQLPGEKCKLPVSNSAACLDMKEIGFPLLLRKWKTGDYFYPLGMKNLPAGRQGKKKLSRFFIDQKLSKTEKEKVWVMESNQRIIWVVGYRIDERFKVTDKTKKVLCIQLTPAK
ncbi:MAG: tRNA lysidine(34) synthetase TilS [Sphingobacteriales bacterium]|nr:tRNA lysidine(34) synthetase TilS [Sphingobacteriales bacterium]